MPERLDFSKCFEIICGRKVELKCLYQFSFKAPNPSNIPRPVSENQFVAYERDPSRVQTSYIKQFNILVLIPLTFLALPGAITMQVFEVYLDRGYTTNCPTKL